MKQKVVSLLQLVLGIGLLVFLFAKMENRDQLVEAILSIADQWWTLIGAIMACLVCLTLSTFRWNALLRGYGIHLPLPQVFQLYFIGHFFNAFMFGAIGGDLVKAVYVAKAVPDRRTEAVSTVFIDRLVGLMALIILATAVMSVRFRFFLRYPETRVIMGFMMALLVGVVVGLVVVFRRNLFEQFSLFKRLEENTVLGAIISKAYVTCHACLNQPMLMAKTLILSFGNHIALITAAFLLGIGLGVRTVPPVQPVSDDGPPPLEIAQEYWNYLTVFPIVNGVSAIPATPGGLGTRDMATKFLLGVDEFQVPTERSVPLSLLLYGVMLVWSLAGGVVYLVYVTKAGRVTREELNAMSDVDSTAGLTPDAD